MGRFNADRRDDLAVGVLGKTAVLLGNADGGLDAAPSSPQLASSLTLKAGEFTSDGRTDLITASNVGVSVWSGDGRGGFAQRSSISVQNPWLQAVADLNADSRADVVLTTSDPGGEQQLRVLLGDGAGTFAQSSAIALPQSTSSALVQDLDGDAHPDVLVGGWALGTRLQTFLGDGAGGLRPAGEATTWDFPVASMAFADLNEDLHADLVVASPGVVNVLFGDGRGHFWNPGRTSVAADWAVRGVQTGDFDADGRQDFIVSGGDSGDVFVYLGTGTGRVHPAPGSPEYGGFYPPAPATAGDFDGDGRLDLAGFRGGSAMSVRLLRNTGGLTPRGQRAQTIQISRPFPDELTRGQEVLLAARLRCHPGHLALYRRPLQRPPGGRWRRIATVRTNAGGDAEFTDTPRVSSEYQWRPTGAGKRTIKSTRRVTVRVLRDRPRR